MSDNKIELIRQALAASESSIKLAKQLLSELERGSVGGGRREPDRPKKDTQPGITGIFDGEQMITDQGEKHPVPENYASKSILVVGDTLKLVEEGGERRFKQIEHVKRHKSIGILAKKDGKWKAVTPEGSYKVLPASVSHYNGDVGDEVVLHLPANNLSVSYGAIESVKNKTENQEAQEKQEAAIQGKELTQPSEQSLPQQPKDSGLKKRKSQPEAKAPGPKVEVEKAPEPIAPKAPETKEEVVEKVAEPAVPKVVDEDELT